MIMSICTYVGDLLAKDLALVVDALYGDKYFAEAMPLDDIELEVFEQF